MTIYTPGEFPASALATIAPGERLVPGAANAYRALVADGAAHRTKITPASPGAAYRDAKTQNEMRAGSLGNVALRVKWDLSSSSTTPIAAHPNGTHEHGDRVDLLFNGSDNPTSAQIALAEKHGWSREFGGDDRNHFRHDGRTDVQFGASSAPTSTTVRSGEGGIRVAERVGISFAQLQKLNPGVKDWGALELGQKLRIR